MCVYNVGNLENMGTIKYMEVWMNKRMDGCVEDCNAQWQRFVLENINMY